MPTYALYLTIDGYWTNRHDHKGWVDKTGQGQAWFWDPSCTRYNRSVTCTCLRKYI